MQSDLNTNGGILLKRAGHEVDRIFDRMLQMILSGEVPAGMKLKEHELAQNFGVSRGPLREAIRRLQERELVFCIPNAGAWVIAHSPQEILEAYEIREALEGLSARLAAVNITEEELIELRAAMEVEIETGKAPIHGGFHSRIVRASHNERLIRMLNVDYFRMLRLWRANCPWLRKGGEETWTDHKRILDAIEHRDGECAEILTRRHIERLRLDSLENLHRLGIPLTDKISAYKR